MGVAGGLSDATTLRAVVDLIDHAAHDDPGPMVPWSVIGDVARLIPAEEVSIADLDLADGTCVVQQGAIGAAEVGGRGRRADDRDPHEVSGRSFRSCWLGRLPSRAGEVRRWSHPGRTGRHRPMWAEWSPPRGVTHALTLGFPAAAGHDVNILFFRVAGSPFTDRDMDLLRLLRPHLAEILAASDRQRLGLLTPREWQVLELAAQGHSNADIATALGMSVATVRKHMEHIFDRVGVRNRSAAVARLLPSRPPALIGGWGIGTGSRLVTGRG